MKQKIINFIVAITILVGLFGNNFNFSKAYQKSITISSDQKMLKLSNVSSKVPKYTGKDYIILNDNIPNFNDKDLTTNSFENYSLLDELGRCGVAYANIGRDLMPNSKRKPIGSVKPSGWHSKKYDIVDGKYLYNRCHLIGFQLTAENANKKNLITGTRYLNTKLMLPYENMVADYIKETGNHVLYRVTPVFEGNNLVATGVQMEAKSVEDNGKSIQFNVFLYNVQPGISINYKDGTSEKINQINI
ncbi:DNA/RNA non-specific endonuclease [Clostridium perfringens]|uniref:DNA/RNA non-specific endonuclease n=1 Tax=Clostridium perfringens TaxID=1502 RepID=UPI00096AB8AD